MTERNCTTIKNCDGTPFQLSGTLNQFDPNNPEHNLVNSFDAEIIEIAGTPIFYYEIFLQLNTLDPLYREDRGKLWSNNPIQLQGFYEPIPSQNYLNMWGIDSPNEIKFQFNYREVLSVLGHPPRIGAKLFTPHKRENWVVIQRNVGDFFLWGELRLTIIAQQFQESLTTGEGKVTQRSPNYGHPTDSVLFPQSNGNNSPSM